MSNFHTLNFKALLFTAIATVPTLLVIDGLDASVQQAETQAVVQTHSDTAPALRLAQLSGVNAKAVLVD